MDNSGDAERTIVPLGYIAGAHGVQGWVKVHSLTEPREAIFDYQPWLLGEALAEVRIRQGKQHGNRLIALLEQMENREQAEALAGQRIAVYREQLAEPAEGQFYWADLIGLSVRLEDGRNLGRVARLLATGANDVLVVQGDRERLIPFVTGDYVTGVDLEGGVITVDWDPDF